MLTPFIERLASLLPLTDDMKNILQEKFIVKTIAPNEIILRDGDCSNYVTVVLSGLLRSYYIKDGLDITSRFTTENEIVLSVNSFYNAVPGYEFIEAMEETVIAQLHRNHYYKLLENHLELNYIVLKFTEKYYAQSEFHLYMLRKNTAEERWQYFLKTYSHLLNRVSLQHIASFLGMTNETLSRMRSKHK